ncbi:MAG: mucoidy inhibitor MuiA family protein [Spirochaetes bacterium]|nr:mucoidy inhibitor MuiA family protein [Spirochaetota bacterium]
MRLPPTAMLACLLSLAGAAPLPAQNGEAGTKTVESAVTAVTVFSDRAQITREAMLTLEPGTWSLQFEKIPTSLDPNSLQIAGTGSAVIVDLKYRTEYTLEFNDQRVRALTARRQTNQDRLDEAAIVLRNLERERAVLEGMKDRVLSTRLEISNATTDTRKWQEILDFYRLRLDKLDGEALTKGREKNRLDADQRLLDQELRDLGGTRRKEKRFIEAVIEVKAAGPVKLKLTYIALGPSWSPVYDVRADRDAKTVKVAGYAVVRQASEEDWRNISLRLSTAKPFLGGNQPTLPAWTLREYVPPPPRAYNRRMVDSEERMKKAEMPSAMSAAPAPAPAAEAAPEPPELKAVEASVDEGQGATVFALDGKATVQNDNQPHRVFLFDREYSAQFQYSAVPKLAPYAFLKATVKNTNEAALLSGPMNIFVNGAYLATGHLGQVSAGEEFSVTLGVDESVSVQHRIVKRYKEADALLSGNNRWSYRFLITVKNNRKTREAILIQDQFPVSTRSEIKVTPQEPLLKKDREKEGLPPVRLSDSGILEWAFDLKPGERIEIPVAFQIEYPRNLAVQGLQ